MAARPGKYIIQFDSSAALVHALAASLRGQGWSNGPPKSLPPQWAVPLNRLPEAARSFIYTHAGWWSALPQGALGDIRAEEAAEWFVSRYPRRRYPAVLVGSANGAAVHLAAALGAPWLPQTFLAAARRRIDPDEILADVAWGSRAIESLLQRNPNLQANQMHDPLQDRLMVSRMAYFRLKFPTLPAAYRRFIDESLEPGGTVIVVDCGFSWPLRRVAPRHFFQLGGLGGIEAREYLRGSERVAAFLAEHGRDKARRRWRAPEPDCEGPESEWGLLPEFAADAGRFARERGWGLCRLRFGHPGELSACVARLLRNWHRARGVPDRRLLIECFILIEPWLAQLTASVPYWLAFNAEDSAAQLERFLNETPGWDEMYQFLMPNGVKSAGLVPVERWRAALSKARRRGMLVGIDAERYPSDIGTYLRYDRDFLKAVPERRLPPPPLSLHELREGLEAFGAPQVAWEWDSPARESEPARGEEAAQRAAR